VHAPPVVGKDVEHAEDQDEERRAPFRLEAHSNHAACRQPDNRHEEPHERPLSLDDEAEEQEDQEDTTGKEEAAWNIDPVTQRQRSEKS
jgi:hypothetical protein